MQSCSLVGCARPTILTGVHRKTWAMPTLPGSHYGNKGVKDSKPVFDHLTMLQVFCKECLASGFEGRGNDEAVKPGEAIALHDVETTVNRFGVNEFNLTKGFEFGQQPANLGKRHGKTFANDVCHLSENLG